LKKHTSTRIIGGTEAVEDRFSYALSLQAYGTTHYCGGSLIAKDVVLTAAHCEGGAGSECGVPSGTYLGEYTGEILAFIAVEENNERTTRGIIKLGSATAGGTGMHFEQKEGNKVRHEILYYYRLVSRRRRSHRVSNTNVVFPTPSACHNIINNEKAFVSAAADFTPPPFACGVNAKREDPSSSSSIFNKKMGKRRKKRTAHEPVVDTATGTPLLTEDIDHPRHCS